MADAGRILIIPKGDYDANSTYEKLDLVRHKGTSWIAKKDTTGIEPSEENAEYWQSMFGISIVDNLTTEESGQALDARQGKILDERITANTEQCTALAEQVTAINNNLSEKIGSIEVSDGYTGVRLKAVETGNMVTISGGLYIPTVGEYKVLTVSGVTLPNNNIDFVCCNENGFGRGFLDPLGKITIKIASYSSTGSAIMFNFTYAK